MGIWLINQPLGGKKSWPSGVDGPLNITTGNTVVLPAGSIKDYSSITIALGATLQIGTGSAWTIIGCSGACNISGQIVAQGGQHTGGTFTTTAPDLQALSYIIVQGTGGTGGAGNAAGGASSSGNGGGGGGSSVGNAASPTAGGDGANGAGSSTTGLHGTGATVYSNNGTSGTASATNTEFTKVGMGGDNSLFIQENGFLYAAGTNANGGVGDNTIADRSSPTLVVGGRSYSAVSHGSDSQHSLAIERSNGQLWAWGNEAPYGQVGFGNDSTTYSSPVSVSVGRSYVQIATNRYNSIGIDGFDGGVYTWGRNIYGQLGTLSLASASAPQAVVGTGLGGMSAAQVTCGFDHMALIDISGHAWTIGRNHVGQLGTNNLTNASSPVSVVGGRSFVAIAAGARHTLGILGSDGSMWAWGDNSGSALGDGTAISRSSPVSVIGTRSYKQVSAGRHWTIALDGAGAAWAWGDNLYGQLGLNTAGIVAQSTPVVVGETTFTATITQLAQPFTAASTLVVPNVQIGWRRDGFPDGSVFYKIVKEFKQNEIQHLAFSAVPAAGTYVLSWNGNNSAAINFNDAAATVQTKIAGITGIGVGQVSVTGNYTSGFDVTFQGTLANTDVSQLSVFSDTLNLNDGVNEIQLVSFTGTATSGSYMLNYNGTNSTAIQWNDNATAVQTALNTIPGIVTTVTGTTGTGFSVTFTTPAHTNVNQLTVTSNTTDFTTISVSTTQNGVADTAVTVTPSTTQQGQSPIPSPNSLDIMWTSEGFTNHDLVGFPFLTPTTNTLVEETPYVTLAAGNYYLVIFVDTVNVFPYTAYTPTYTVGNDITVKWGSAGPGNALSWNGSTWSSIGAPLWHVIWDANNALMQSPSQVLGLHNFVQVAAGKRSVLGVDTSGSVWAWGYGGTGILGTNTVANASTPVAVARVFSVTGTNVYGAGGGGGSRGAHGQGIYLHVVGNIAGVGSIIADGLSGGNGGNGGNANDPYDAWQTNGGGGGGGGAGGSGGKIVIRYHGTLSAISTSVNGATGGTGGTGGVNISGMTPPTDEVQALKFSAVPTAGQFTLSHNGNQTTPILWSDTSTTIQSAINALPSIRGGVTVLGSYSQVQQVQRLTFSATPTSGSFIISFAGKTTSTILFSATSTDVQNALNSMQALSGQGISVVVTGSFAAGFNITFSPAYDYPQFTIVGNTLSNGGSVTVTPSIFTHGNPGFTITFTGAEGATSEPLLVIATNTLTSGGAVTASVLSVQKGAPSRFANLGQKGGNGATGTTGIIDIAAI